MPLLVAAAWIEQDDGRVLMQQRPAHKHHGGLWEFPGGKLEDGESPAAALARELSEELGIIVEPGHPVPAGWALSEAANGRPLALLLMRVTAWEGVAQPLEGGAIGWFAPQAIFTLPLPPGDRALLDQRVLG